MHRLTELLIRNSDRFDQPSLLLINPPRDSGFRSLCSNGRKVKVFTQDFGDYQWFLSSGATASFGVIPPPGEADSDRVLIQPRERQRLDMMLHALSHSGAESGRLWLAGENRTGIKSARKNLAKWFESPEKADNARHCVLFQARGPIRQVPFDLSEYHQHWQLEPPLPQVRLTSIPGVFAHGKLDAGTRLLLSCLAELSIKGSVLDFACGCGVIGLAILAMQPEADLTFLDSSALALESTRLSSLANHHDARLLPSDGLAEVAGTFDWIVTNPPFHRGVDNDLEIARRFFQSSTHHLSKTGKLVLVYNKHLPYLAWLRQHYDQVEIIGSNAGFNVVRAAAPYTTD